MDGHLDVMRREEMGGGAHGALQEWSESTSALLHSRAHRLLYSSLLPHPHPHPLRSQTHLMIRFMMEA